jgi:hypothetical protein
VDLAVSACAICGAEPCINPSFCRTSREADRRRALGQRPQYIEAWPSANEPALHPTPQTTMDAILYCVRERGVAALKEPANVERLSRCDAAAKRQIDARIDKLISLEGKLHDPAIL